MKVQIADIPEAGLKLDAGIPAREIDLDDSFFKCLTPLSVHGQVVRAQDEVVANVDVSGRFEFDCARCLEPVTEEQSQHMDLYFDVTPQTEFVDIGDEIRQELILTLAGIKLCKKDCRGLCPHCGTNLNQKQCDCHLKIKEESDGRGINI